MKSSAARIFYAFHPADENPDDKPLVVFFNGGPSVSTGLLFGTNTGPVTMVPDLVGPDGYADNPASWTTFANVMWIDARAAGFSYGMMDDPSNSTARLSEFDTRNFNAYLDAADFARTIIRFLDDHPVLTDNDVVIVGESYGGTRATVLMNLLLFFPEYDSGGDLYYQDPALAEELGDHFALAFPDEDTFTPEVVAEQFGHEVLIQPLFTGQVQGNEAGDLFEMPGSVMYDVEQVCGQAYVPCGNNCNKYQNGLNYVQSTCGRSQYDWTADISWLNDLFAWVDAAFNTHDVVAAGLGLDPSTVFGLPATDRTQAYKLGSYGYPTDEVAGDMPDHLGALESWDRYFISFNYEGFPNFRSQLARNLDVDIDDPHYGELFLRNLLHTETFITDAAWDVIIYAPSFAPAMASYGAITDSAVHVTDEPMGEDRPGQIVVDYTASPFPDAPDPGTRTVRFPPYQASHSVTLDAPTELRDDVESWYAGG
jgi:hypothetical protein